MLHISLSFPNRENKALSSIEIYRTCYREGLLEDNLNFTWLTVDDLIKQEIKKNRENSLFIEVKQGIYTIRERFQLKEKRDLYDQIKEEYDWAFYRPVSRIILTAFRNQYGNKAANDLQ